MKSNLLKSLIALLGFGGFTSCFIAAEYGCPHADFSVVVNAQDPKGEPVMGMKVSIVRGQTDTIALGLTDRMGMYYTKQQVDGTTPVTIKIGLDDIDGTAHNGEFESQHLYHTFQREDFVGGDGDWYEGLASTSYTLTLKEKEQQQEEQ